MKFSTALNFELQTLHCLGRKVRGTQKHISQTSDRRKNATPYSETMRRVIRHMQKHNAALTDWKLGSDSE
jgi:hypothetical protein